MFGTPKRIGDCFTAWLFSLRLSARCPKRLAPSYTKPLRPDNRKWCFPQQRTPRRCARATLVRPGRLLESAPLAVLELQFRPQYKAKSKQAVKPASTLRRSDGTVRQGNPPDQP